MVLLEEVEVFEERSQVDDDARLEGGEVYLREVQQFSYFDLILSRSVALEDMCFKGSD